MKDKFKLMIIAVLVTALALIAAGCSAVAERGELQGELTMVADNSISVDTDEGIKEIKTDSKTIYDTGSEDHFCIDDIVSVEYRSSLGKMTAEKITLVKHKEKVLSFEGLVTEASGGMLTVTSESVTVSFTFDENTMISGDPDEGDEVLIGYSGNISEFPYAVSISVQKEAEEPESYTVSGIISEFTETTVMLALDSATSYRFTINKDTKVTGVAKYLRVGDSVNITYSGDIKNTPEAKVINIVKETQEERRTVNGTIRDVTKKYVTLDTGKKVYIINTNKDTKYTGDKPKKGYKSEVTYTGNLKSGAVAVSIYCVKSASDAKPKEKDAPSPAPAPAPAPQPTPTPSPEPSPTPVPEDPITADGTITAWRIDGANTGVIKLKDESEITVNVNENTIITDGYDPMQGDIVNVIYKASDMTLLEIKLIERPDEGDRKDSDPEGDPQDEGGDDGKEETPVQPDEQEETPAQPEDQDRGGEESAAEVAVKAEGSITAVDKDKSTCTIKLKNGEELVVGMDSDTEIAAGYFPEVGDEVKVTYKKEAMHLDGIQLINRPAPKEEAQAAEGSSGEAQQESAE